ncbi:MAG TPA: CBS domain-containing protein [Ktedonobacteraceae bacterium]|nr:CBS domain-containing protein [Ktedonobacteraceae bacterium]
MLYLSQLLGAPVEDPQGVRIGKIIDITIEAAQVEQPEQPYINALLVEGQEEHPLRVPREVVTWQGEAALLRAPATQLPLQLDASLPDEISLAHDVLDKKVIDVVHKKAVLVNDVCLSDDWRLLGVDNSMLGLLRRLTPSWLPGARPRPTAPNIIPWKDIQLIDAHQDQEAETQATHAFAPRPTSGQLAELRPADIAEIVHQLSPGEGARLIESLDDETAADTMEEVDTERQRHILENIQSARAADILEAMGPDEAADLLAQLPKEHAQELLKLMKPEESEDVQDLLEYEANSAGGLMTTDYIKLNQTKTVAQALDAVRSSKQQQDMHAAYVYCVADETQDECTLLGVVSLWDLLVASSDQILQDLMETDMITVHPDTDPRTVAQIMAKYNLLAVPVVSQEGILEGVVTVDDALDILLPADKRRKPARMY